MPSTPEAQARYTLALDPSEWKVITDRADLTTEREQASALHMSRWTLNRIRNGHQTPGPEFIAAVRICFPRADTERLFRVVEKVAS